MQLYRLPKGLRCRSCGLSVNQGHTCLARRLHVTSTTLRLQFAHLRIQRYPSSLDISVRLEQLAFDSV